MLSLNNTFNNLKNKKILYILALTTIFNICPQNVSTSYAGGLNENGIWNPYDNDISEGASIDRSSHMMDKTLEEQRAEAAQKKAAQRAKQQQKASAGNSGSSNSNSGQFTGPNNSKNLTNAGKNEASYGNAPNGGKDPNEAVMTQLSNGDNDLKNTDVKTLGADRNLNEIEVDDADLSNAKDKCLALVNDEKVCDDESILKQYAQCLKAYDNNETACAFFLDRSSAPAEGSDGLTGEIYDFAKKLATALGYDSVAKMLLCEGGMLALGFIPGIGIAAWAAKLAKAGKYANAMSKLASKYPSIAKIFTTLNKGKKAEESEKTLSEVTKHLIDSSKGDYVKTLKDVEVASTKSKGILSKYFGKGLEKEDVASYKNQLLKITEDEAKGSSDKELAQKALNNIEKGLSRSENNAIKNKVLDVKQATETFVGHNPVKTTAGSIIATDAAENAYVYNSEKNRVDKLNKSTSEEQNAIANKKIEYNNQLLNNDIPKQQNKIKEAAARGDNLTEDQKETVKQAQENLSAKEEEIKLENERIRQVQYNNDVKLKQTTQSYTDYINSKTGKKQQ